MRTGRRSRQRKQGSHSFASSLCAGEQNLWASLDFLEHLDFLSSSELMGLAPKPAASSLPPQDNPTSPAQIHSSFYCLGAHFDAGCFFILSTFSCCCSMLRKALGYHLTHSLLVLLPCKSLLALPAFHPRQSGTIIAWF